MEQLRGRTAWDDQEQFSALKSFLNPVRRIHPSTQWMSETQNLMIVGKGHQPCCGRLGRCSISLS